jgi:hypothetical protein
MDNHLQSISLCYQAHPRYSLSLMSESITIKQEEPMGEDIQARGGPLRQRESYLIYVVEMGFHALDSDVLVRFSGLRFQYFRKRSLALLADESIFYPNKF